MKTILPITIVITVLFSLGGAQNVPANPRVDSPWIAAPNTHSGSAKDPQVRPPHPSPATVQAASGGRMSVPPPDSVVTTITAGPVRLGPGDLLEIGVFDSPELTTRTRVNSGGEITFPLLGRLHVGGATPEETQAAIEKQLAEKDMVRDPQVTVFVLEYANQAVYVLGEVNKPGAYPVMGSHRLFDFISAAGGLTARAGRSITIARRATSEPELVRMGHDPDFSAGNPDVCAGDTIYVAQAGLVYVVGDVARPGGFLMDPAEKLTLLQALALAEGVKPTAALGRARLVRTSEQGRQEIPLDLKKIFALQVNDPTLQDQDIVYVPNSVSRTGFRRGMEAALQTVVGVAIYRR